MKKNVRKKKRWKARWNEINRESLNISLVRSLMHIFMNIISISIFLCEFDVVVFFLLRGVHKKLNSLQNKQLKLNWIILWQFAIVRPIDISVKLEKCLLATTNRSNKNVFSANLVTPLSLCCHIALAVNIIAAVLFMKLWSVFSLFDIRFVEFLFHSSCVCVCVYECIWPCMIVQMKVAIIKFDWAGSGDKMLMQFSTF